MSRHKWIPTLLVIAACSGTSVAAENVPLDATFTDAHAKYQTALTGMLQCLEEEGFPASAEVALNGVFYMVGFETPSKPDLASYQSYAADRDEAFDRCHSKDLTEAIVSLERITRPTDQELRQIAAECATDSKVPLSDDAEIALAEVASKDGDAAACIVGTISALTNSRFGGTGTVRVLQP